MIAVFKKFQSQLITSQKNIWYKTIWRTLHFFAIFDIQPKLLRSRSVVMFCSFFFFFFFFFWFLFFPSFINNRENTEKYFFNQRDMQRTKNWPTLEKKPWNFVILGLLPTSLHLEFVEENFVLAKVQATNSY
jgi:hypothetical protein